MSGNRKGWQPKGTALKEQQNRQKETQGLERSIRANTNVEQGNFWRSRRRYVSSSAYGAAGVAYGQPDRGKGVHTVTASCCQTAKQGPGGMSTLTCISAQQQVFALCISLNDAANGMIVDRNDAQRWGSVAAHVDCQIAHCSIDCARGSPARSSPTVSVASRRSKRACARQSKLLMQVFWKQRSPVNLCFVPSWPVATIPMSSR